MRLRNVKNASNIIDSSNYVIKNPESYIGNYKKLFKNNNKICLEIGMGKGDFIIGMAKKYPNINFIGVEKYESVLVRAIEKLKDLQIDNLLLICCDAINIDNIFNKEIDTIYLNFSDPWPKKRHEKRRLTSQIFLEKYDKIFENNAHIIQKTDNILLFAYTIKSLSDYDYKFNHITLDLENEDIDNVITEYEKKFMSLNERINYLDAYKNKPNK